jgi:hypothetical protein
MPRGGRKYRLLLYQNVLDRWWPVTLTLAVILFLYIAALWWGRRLLPGPLINLLPELAQTNGTVLALVGALALLLSLALLGMRRGAYLQLFDTYLCLKTPFLRVNIAYKRIQRTTTAQVATLFPPSRYKGWKRDIITSIDTRTAIVLHLTAYPLPRATFNLFLSPFFYYDATPHFVLVVDDWMAFSMELDSRRATGKTSRPDLSKPSTSELLDDLTRK